MSSEHNHACTRCLDITWCTNWTCAINDGVFLCEQCHQEETARATQKLSKARTKLPTPK